MGTVIPESEALKKAIRWISACLKKDDKISIKDLINEAVFRFDLTPKDSQFLYNFYRHLREQSKE